MEEGAAAMEEEAAPMEEEGGEAAAEGAAMPAEESAPALEAGSLRGPTRGLGAEHEAAAEAAAGLAEVGPAAVAAAGRVRDGRRQQGDVWCLLSAYDFEALAWLPAGDRDELLLLAALDRRLRRLLDDAGRAQVDELLEGAAGDAVRRARVSMMGAASDTHTAACPERGPGPPAPTPRSCHPGRF